MRGNLSQYRKDFPMLQKQMHGKPLIYLDTAATSQKPQAVIDAITDFYSNHYGTVHRTIYELSLFATDQYENTRAKIAQFIGAKKAEEIIFTRGTTDAINLVAYSLGQTFEAGDEILISETEHHSNIVPWQLLCERNKTVLKIIPVDDRGVINLDLFEKMVTHKTKLVAIAHISNSTGTLHPIKQMIEIAHRKQAKVLIDGAQAAPHIRLNMQDLDADFYAFSGHKIYGPTGIGVLYGKEEILNAMVPYQGGGDMVEWVTFEKTTYNKAPLKFEAGTPNIEGVLGLGAAIDYLSAIGLEKIHLYEQQLLKLAEEKIKTIPGLKIMGTAPEKGSILTFYLDGIHSLDIGTLLDLQGVAIRTGHFCTHPTLKRFGVKNGACRASFSFYNTKEEINQFIEILKNIILKLI